MKLRTFAPWLALCLAGAAQTAGAGEHARIALHPTYQQECSACHVAYPPQLLPAASWQRIMNGLPKHFGTDASVDAATLKELSGWLAQHAGSGKRAAEPPPEDRITRSSWFMRKHDEVRAATWKLPTVKSAANCAACHTRANEGDFDENNIRIPR